MADNTLLLRLVGPMQSWGVQSRFGLRDTGREPSKSGVIGLLCAALGRPRYAPIDDLTILRMGVRVDKEGNQAMDYHTAQNVLKAGGGIKDTELSRRYYLNDAAFLVGLESEELSLLTKLHSAMQNPHWPLYLGRKAFVPGLPIWLPDGLQRGESLKSVFLTYPRLGKHGKDYQSQLRVVLDDPDGEQVRPDFPVSFVLRQFAPRRVRTTFWDAPPIPKEIE